MRRLLAMFFVLFGTSLGASAGASGLPAGSNQLPNDLKRALGIEELPPVDKRIIIGTWQSSGGGCTRSFEQVEKKYYDVRRCKDGSGGNDGIPIQRMSKKTFMPIPPRRSGDHYVIESSGALEVRDNDGLVETLPKQNGLWPKR